MKVLEHFLGVKSGLFRSQTKFFPTIKSQAVPGKADSGTITPLVDRLLRHKDQPTKVKIVVGQKLFKRKSQEIKTSIENSTHFM